MLYKYLDVNATCDFTSFCEDWDVNFSTSFTHEFIIFARLLCFFVFGMQVHHVRVS